MIWELFQSWAQFGFAGLLILLLFVTFRRFKSDKIYRETPDILYILFRYKAKILLNLAADDTKTLLDLLQKSMSDLISMELKLTCLPTTEEIEELEEFEFKIKDLVKAIWKSLRESIPAECLEKRQTDVWKALCFELDSGLIKMPTDILGRRRSFRLKMLFKQEIVACDETERETDDMENLKQIPGKENGRMVMLGGIGRAVLSKLTQIVRKAGADKFLKKHNNLLIFIVTIVLGTSFHAYDIYTDAAVVYQYYTLAHGGDERVAVERMTYMSIFLDIFDGMSGQNLKKITANSTVSEVKHIHLENTYVRITFFSFLLFVILWISAVIIFPQLPTLVSLFYVARSKVCSKIEAKNYLDPFTVLNRYNVARSESGVESNLQLIFQISTYLVMSWEITWLTFDIEEEEKTEELFKMKSLWKSFVMSVLSISLGQYKTRMVLHEFSTSGSKKLAYFLACLMNTMFSSLIWISLGMAIFDFLTYGGFWKTAGNQGGGKMIFYGIIACYFFILIIPLFTHILQLPTSSVSPDVTSTKSEEFHRRLIKQFVFLSLILIVNGGLNVILVGLAESMLTPALNEFGGSIFNDHKVSNILTPSAMPGSARENFILYSTIIIPVCFVQSYVLLHIYFKDNTACVRFEKNTGLGKTSKEKLSLLRVFRSLNIFGWFLKPQVPAAWLGYSIPVEKGFWVDISDLGQRNVEEVGLDEKKFLRGEFLDQTILESVLQSVPVWRQKLKLT